MLRFISRVLVTTTLFVTPFACGGNNEGNCVDLCSEAQAGDCTAIAGDCSRFCSALFNVEDPSGCADEREEYQSCLNAKADVCDNDCALQENALSTCVGTYCLANSSEPDCQTLLASF